MKDIQALGWMWYNHTPEMFAFCMLDINRDWLGYVAGKQRLFADDPLSFIGSLSDHNMIHFIDGMVTLYDVYLQNNSLGAANYYATEILESHGIKI